MAMLETAEVILDSLSTNGEAIENVTFKPFMSHGSKVFSLSNVFRMACNSSSANLPVLSVLNLGSEV